MQYPKIHTPEIEYKNQYQRIYRISADFHTFHKDYFVTYYGIRAALLVVREEDILLVRQYRFLINDISWEIPGGTTNDGESPKEAAIRECYEESGLVCKNLSPLINYHLGLDITDNPTYVYTCYDFEYSPNAILDEKETTKIEWVPLAKCFQMIFNQTILDSMTILAILAYYAKQNMNIKGFPDKPLLEHHYLKNKTKP